MKKDFQWKDEEIKKLFSVVESGKEKSKSLIECFSEFAKISGRKKNSIRNYYYHELNRLQSDTKRCKKLGINLKNHTIANFENFSSEETFKLVKDILREKCLGNSVRKSCYNLACGNLELMIRFQNKFRNVVKTNPNLIEKSLNELKKEGLQIKTENVGVHENVIQFKKPENQINDRDINSLFLGLIKLVKKTAEENLQKTLVKDLEMSNSSLRKTLVKLSNAEEKILEFERENKKLSNENLNLKNENAILKSEIANLLNKVKNKQRRLADFINEMKRKEIKKHTN